MRVAGVPSRGENLNVNPSANPTSRTTLERLLEIFVGLAGEADDHVGRHRQAGNRRAELRDALEIAFARVAAQHALEHARRSGLHRQMHVLAHRVGLGHRRDDAIAEVVRVRTREAQATHAVDAADRAQQIGEIVLAVVVRVHRLAEQYDFAHALGDDGLRLRARRRASWRLRSGPRVVGTMQYVQR